MYISFIFSQLYGMLLLVNLLGLVSLEEKKGKWGTTSLKNSLWMISMEVNADCTPGPKPAVKHMPSRCWGPYALQCACCPRCECRSKVKVNFPTEKFQAFTLAVWIPCSTFDIFEIQTRFLFILIASLWMLTVKTKSSYVNDRLCCCFNFSTAFYFTIGVFVEMFENGTKQ